MSDPQFDSEGEAVEVIKKEKREKKLKKSKSKNKSDEQNTTDEPKPSKKRKREILPEEIEIDVNLPEPASKKAARKAKKGKTQHTPSADATDGAQEAKPKSENLENTEAKEHSGKRSDYGVWIGNLPWSATKDSLRAFLTENAEIKTDEITRIHMPTPKQPPRPNWQSEKPQNKGFAYVDFSTQLAMYSAIALTETKMDGRALLIKNAKNFEGRPDKPKTEEEKSAGRNGKEAKKPSKKVFVGNLAFETSKENLIAHFGPCGTVEDIHMATFEDSGKCKGYAWVTFEDVDAATSAVKGFVYKTEDSFKKKKFEEAEEDEEGTQEKSKKRKYRLNKLMGRDLRCEFAEDSTTRYQKRYGKEKKEDGDGIVEVGGDRRLQNGRKPYTPSSKPFKPRGKVDPRSIRPGAAHANAPRASAAIVESKGKKTTFA